MTNRFILHFAISLCACLWSMGAMAQSCNYQRDLIFEIKDGQIGAYNVWDGVYGDVDGAEGFASALNVGVDDTVAAGVQTLNGVRKLILVKFDYRGRVTWEKAHDVAGLRDVVKILPAIGDGFIVLANVGAKGKAGKAWAGIFNAKGDLTRKTGIRHPQKTLIASDITPMRARKGYVMSANVVDKEGMSNSAIYFLNSKGQVISHRSFLTGPQNKILNIGPAGEDGYMATGQLGTDDDRDAGWAMRLNNDASVVWQQQYVRGASNALQSSHPYRDQFFVLGGYSDPHRGAGGVSKRSGWVMVVNAVTGELVWQRYYTGTYAYAVRDVLVSEDGLISALLDGDWTGAEGGGYDPSTDLGERKDIDYASLLTIDPRGTLLFSDPHYFAQGSDAKQMYYGQKGQRVLVGTTRTLYQIEALSDDDAPSEAKSRISPDGWVLVTPATDPYTDPCLRP